MADVRKVVEIVMQGDDKLSKTLDTVSTKFGDLEQALTPIADFAKNVLALETALAGLAVAGLTVAVNEAGKFSDSINEINTLVGLSDENLVQFKDDIKDYAQTSSSSIEDINAAVYNAISAGTEYKDVISALSLAETLADAGRANLTDTTALLTGAMNAYGASSEEAEGFTDALFQAVKFGATTIPELSSSLGGIVGVASAAGVSFDELAAAVAGITATAGVSTAEAVTQLKGVISNIIKPTSDAAKAADELGIEFNASALESKGLEGVLKDVIDATGGNIETMGRLFGSVKGLAGALVLGKDESGAFAAALEGMENKAGAAQQAYEHMADNFGIVNANLANNVRLTFIEIGENLTDEYVDVARALSNVFKGIQFSINEGAFDPIIGLVETFGANIATFMEGVAESLPEALANTDFSEFVESIESIGTGLVGVFEGIFGEVDLTTPEGLASVLQTIVDTLTNFNQIVGGVIEGVTPLFDLIGGAVDIFTSLDGETVRLAGTIAGLGLAAKTASGFISTITGAIGGLTGLKITSAITNIGALGAKATGSVTGLAGIATKLTFLTGPLGFVALGAAALAAGAILAKELAPKINEGADALFEYADEVFNITGLEKDWKDGSIKLQNEVKALEENVALAKEGFIKYGDEIIAIPDKKTTEIEAVNIEPTKEEIDEYKKLIAEVPDTKYTEMLGAVNEESIDAALLYFAESIGDNIPIDVTAFADVEAAENAIEEIRHIAINQEVTLEAAADIYSAQQASQDITDNVDKVVDVNAFVTPDVASAKEADDKIKQNIDKELEIQAQIDLKEIDLEIEKVKAAAETVQTAIEWEARIDIADIEAAASVLRSAFETIGTTVTSTGETLGTFVTALATAEGLSRSIIESEIRKESERRDEALRLQTELTEAEIKLIEEKTRLLRTGGYKIQLEASGLDPHLNAIWMEIMAQIQAEIVETGGEFLIEV